MMVMTVINCRHVDVPVPCTAASSLSILMDRVVCFLSGNEKRKRRASC